MMILFEFSKQISSPKTLNRWFKRVSSLEEFMRSESISVICEIAAKTVEEQQLSVLEFLVRAFAGCVQEFSGFNRKDLHMIALQISKLNYRIKFS
ncbi:hypothetical protein SLE2022_286420 [Rubroshorea leprosula]